jgi:probable HAF family extracellular repeat protein
LGSSSIPASPNASIIYGFTYSNGTWTTLADPSATGGTVGNPLSGSNENGTYVTGVNNLGQIVGSFDDSNGTHGFLYSDGTWTTLDDPAATGGTFATGINDFGQIVGYYFDGTGSHGFLYNGNTYITFDDPLATGGPSLGPGNTFGYGINDSGQIVGKYFAADGEHGFLADPAQVTVNSGATYEISTASADAVTYAGNTGTLQLDQSLSFAGTLANFGGQDQIDLRDIAFSPSTTLGYTADVVNTGGTMTVSDGVHNANIALFGQYTAGSFAMASDGHGGTLITDPAPAPQNQLAPPHA